MRCDVSLILLSAAAFLGACSDGTEPPVKGGGGDYAALKELQRSVDAADGEGAPNPPIENVGADTPPQFEGALDDNDRRMIAQYGLLNGDCRGSVSPESPETIEACNHREQLALRMAQRNLCNGTAGQAGYQMEWHRCGPDSLGAVFTEAEWDALPESEADKACDNGALSKRQLADCTAWRE